MSSSNVHVTSPDAYIVAFPFKTEKTNLGDKFSPSTLDSSKPILITKDIISISTTKGKGAAGQWHATLASSQNYKAHLFPGCWVMIYINDSQYDKYNDGSSKNSGLKMVGVIRSSRCIESNSGGIRNIRYEISGDDFHSALQSNIYINSLLRIDQNKKTAQAATWIIFEKVITGSLSPNMMVNELLDAVLLPDVGTTAALEYSDKKVNAKVGGNIGIPLELSKRLGKNTNKFNDILKRSIHKDLPGTVTPQPSVGEQYTLWGLIKAYSHGLTNEVYTDLVSDGDSLTPGIVHRPIPFGVIGVEGGSRIIDSNPADQLYVSKQIDEGEILNLNYGKSDAERFNLFLIGSNFSHDVAYTAFNLEHTSSKDLANLGDANSIARFGLRPYIASSDYVVATEDIKKINKIVRDIWSTGHLYENGQVTIVGAHEHIPVGTNIEFKERKWIAHIEAVSHSYSVSPEGDKSYFTTLSFVRMQTKDGKPIDMVEKGKRDSDPGATHSNGGEQ